MKELTSINLDKVIESPDFCSIVKMTAVKMKKNPYMTLGDFFKSLTLTDLTVLNLIVTMAIEEDDVQSIDNLIVLVEMLSRAEGTETDEIKTATSNVNYFCTLVTLCSLAHKGLIKAVYENMSFGADMKDKQIAEIIEYPPTPSSF